MERINSEIPVQREMDKWHLKALGINFKCQNIKWARNEENCNIFVQDLVIPFIERQFK